MRVAILGCGPSGLLAAHAASLEGAQVHIFSNLVKSEIPGAVFLHEAIPGILTEPDDIVNFYKVGNREGYASKVYGSADAPCSWDLFPEGARKAWSMRSLYDALWLKFQDDIIPHLISRTSLYMLTRSGYDYVISTVPAPVLCYNPRHKFPAQPVLIADRATYSMVPEQSMVYNGDPETIWYRSSRLFGGEATEFGYGVSLTAARAALPNANIVQGKKPIGTNCNCHQGVIRAGRFGTWTKGVLVHHSYKQVRDLLRHTGRMEEF